jgi:hypothetical protein
LEFFTGEAQSVRTEALVDLASVEEAKCKLKAGLFQLEIGRFSSSSNILLMKLTDDQ